MAQSSRVTFQTKHLMQLWAQSVPALGPTARWVAETTYLLRSVRPRAGALLGLCLKHVFCLVPGSSSTRQILKQQSLDCRTREQLAAILHFALTPTHTQQTSLRKDEHAPARTHAKTNQRVSKRRRSDKEEGADPRVAAARGVGRLLLSSHP
eukprot:1605966-Rhodomonas_salina.1